MMTSKVTPRLGIAAAVLVALAAAAPAAELPAPSASYAGDGVMTSEMGAIPFRIFADGAFERREMTAQGSTQIVIKRPDLGVTYLVMPASNMVMEMPDDGEPVPSSADEMAAFNPTPVGSEVIAGEQATKYALSGVDANGAAFDGHAWITDDGIMLRMEGTSSGVHRDMAMTIELTSLARGPQDPALFELPADVPTMRFEGMMGEVGAMPNMPPGAAMPDMRGMEGMEGMEGMPDMEALRRQLELQLEQLNSLQGKPADQ